MTGIGIDTVLSGIVGVELVGEVEGSLVITSVAALWIVRRREEDENEKGLVLHERLLRANERKETYLFDFENMFVCDVADTGFGGSEVFTA